MKVYALLYFLPTNIDFYNTANEQQQLTLKNYFLRVTSIKELQTFAFLFFKRNIGVRSSYVQLGC